MNDFLLVVHNVSPDVPSVGSHQSPCPPVHQRHFPAVSGRPLTAVSVRFVADISSDDVVGGYQQETSSYVRGWPQTGLITTQQKATGSTALQSIICDHTDPLNKTRHLILE